MKLSTVLFTSVVTICCTLNLVAVGEETKVKPLEIKGVYVDKAPDCDHIATFRSGIDLKQGTEVWTQWCDDGLVKRFDIMFLGGTARMHISKAPDGIVKTILVAGFDFDKAYAAFTKKYGKPTKKEEALSKMVLARSSTRSKLFGFKVMSNCL